MRIIYSLLFFVFIFLISACETKVNLVAQGEESSVVIGFLDPTVDTQFVRINKTFITDGSAIDAAQNRELSEYNDLEAYVYALDGNDTINTFLLQEKNVTNKDSGLFFYPEQTVYYFVGSVNTDYSYSINFFGSGKDVSGLTKVVGEFIDNNSLLLPTIRLVNVFNVDGSVYATKKLSVVASDNTKRYEFTFRYNYVEFYTDGSSSDKHIDFKDPPWIVGDINTHDESDFFVEGQDFYEILAGRILDQGNEENVTKRVIGTLDYIFEYTGAELNTFIELNEPSTSINPTQNSYTNITNGIGVFSSRGRKVFDSKTLELNSIKEMALGQFTGGLKFCSDDPGHTGTDWGCN